MFIMHNIKEKTEVEKTTEKVLALGEAMFDSINVSNDDIKSIVREDKGNHVAKFVVCTVSGKKFSVEIVQDV